MLQCVAVCCSALQCVVVCCRCSVLPCVAVRCSVLLCVAVRCSVFQCVAVRLYCAYVYCFLARITKGYNFTRKPSPKFGRNRYVRVHTPCALVHTFICVCVRVCASVCVHVLCMYHRTSDAKGVCVCALAHECISAYVCVCKCIRACVCVCMTFICVNSIPFPRSIGKRKGL